jgi:hypothetical protein
MIVDSGLESISHSSLVFNVNGSAARIGVNELTIGASKE